MFNVGGGRAQFCKTWCSSRTPKNRGRGWMFGGKTTPGCATKLKKASGRAYIRNLTVI